mgnify:CR=1 FL=1
MALLLKSLSALPCFNNITQISAMTGGLSNPCFKVAADNNFYFAKFTNEQQLANELTLAKIAEFDGITPKLYYHDEQWLISHFIDGNNLAVEQIPLKTKIKISIELMIRFHQLTGSNPEKINTETIETLNTRENFNGLICPDYDVNLIRTLNNIGSVIETLITSEIKTSSNNLVCCHCDINFSNVLRDNKQRAWLIDFEYACFAPVEFDLAMFIAVNNIPESEMCFIIDYYKQRTNSAVETGLLRHYLLYCYLINGLWYYNMSFDKTAVLQHRTQSNMLKLAAEQWQAFDRLSSQLEIPEAAPPLQEFI